MKESEYINVYNLAEVGAALTIIRDLQPDEKIVKKDDRNHIESILVRWQTELHKAIKIK